MFITSFSENYTEPSGECGFLHACFKTTEEDGKMQLKTENPLQLFYDDTFDMKTAICFFILLPVLIYIHTNSYSTPVQIT